MNILGSLTLLAVGLVVGAVGAFYYFKPAQPLLEDAKYVIAFKEVPLANPTAFIAALKVPDKAIFRRDMRVQGPSGPPVTPPGLEDADTTTNSVMKISPSQCR